MDEKKGKNNEIDIDDMLTTINPYGKFQKVVNLLFCVMTVPPIFQIMIFFFAGDVPDWRCKAGSTKCLLNGTFTPKNDLKCSKKDWVYDVDWEYVMPKSYSVVTSFGIHCSNAWMSELLTSIFFVGWLVGAIVLGFCADNYGRRVTVIVSFTATLLTGFISIFMPNLYLLVVCRFIIGFFIPGTFSQMFILITEIVDSKHRPFAGIMIFVFGLSSLSLLGVKAYFIRNWKILHIVCTAPYAFMVFAFKFIPESVRFLRVKGKMDELMATFRRMASWNNKTIPANITISPLSSSVSSHKSNPFHLFRTRRLALKSSIQTFAYFTNGLVYYGLYLAAADFGGDKYRDYVIISVTELPVCFIGIHLCEKIGRKKTSVLPMMVAAVACVALGYIPKDGWKKILRIIVGMLGKCLIGSNSNTMTTWSMEIYPTVLRGEAMGFFQAFMRLGAAAAPWINDEFVKLNKAASYLFMAAVAFMAFLLLGMLPETKGVVTSDVETDEKDPSKNEADIELSVQSQTNGGLELPAEVERK